MKLHNLSIIKNQNKNSKTYVYKFEETIALITYVLITADEVRDQREFVVKRFKDKYLIRTSIHLSNETFDFVKMALAFEKPGTYKMTYPKQDKK